MDIEIKNKMADVITKSAISCGSVFFSLVALTCILFSPLFFIASVVLLIIGQDFNGISPMGASVMAVGFSLCGATYSRLGKSVANG